MSVHAGVHNGGPCNIQSDYQNVCFLVALQCSHPSMWSSINADKMHCSGSGDTLLDVQEYQVRDLLLRGIYCTSHSYNA